MFVIVGLISTRRHFFQPLFIFWFNIPLALVLSFLFHQIVRDPPEDVATHLQEVRKTDERYQPFISENRRKIEEIYSWDKIVDQYANHFEVIENMSRV